MSTFYLLPPRPLLGERFADYLQDLLPGLTWGREMWDHLADVLAEAVAQRSDVFVIHREDLPTDEEPARALLDGYGAEIGDEVIEVRVGGRPGELITRRWRLQLSGLV